MRNSTFLKNGTQNMSNTNVEVGSGNADEMLIKASLATKISETIERRHLTQNEAADIVGLSQPKLSELLRGQFRDVSESKMMECLAKLA